MKIPLVAIIGLPNSGKSTFFNKIMGRRTALTHEEAGTTRDRAYGLTQWSGFNFNLVDTAGIINRPDSPLEKNIQKQTQIALEEADLIIFMVDGKSIPSSEDRVVAQKLQRSGKPVILGANKIDTHNAKTLSAAAAFKNLGLGDPYNISSVNGSGMGDLLDRLVELLKPEFSGEHDEHIGRLRVAFVGKPNVGKSSLINRLLKEDRMLVDATAGTTRSTVEIPFDFENRKYLLMDTAGIKKKWKQEIDIEAAAMMQSLKTISQIDVALFVLDATEKITVQDQVISQKIIEQDRPVVVLLNKVDELSKEQQQRLLDILPDHFPQLWWAPVVFTSAKNDIGLDRALRFASDIAQTADKEIDSAQLDAFLDHIIENFMPGKMDDQRSPKLYNLKQIAVRPPTFRVLVNFPNSFAQSWKKLFEKQFRLKFGFEGTPIIITYARKE